MNRLLLCKEWMKKDCLKQFLEWFQPGRRRRKRRPRNSCMQEITTGMREKGINNMEWID